jgi:hypothetical protein
MDYRRMRLISWTNGYDIRDYRDHSYRAVVSKRVRKQEKNLFRKELEEREDIYDVLMEFKGYGPYWREMYWDIDNEPFWEAYDEPFYF